MINSREEEREKREKKKPFGKKRSQLMRFRQSNLSLFILFYLNAVARQKYRNKCFFPTPLFLPCVTRLATELIVRYALRYAGGVHPKKRRCWLFFWRATKYIYIWLYFKSHGEKAYSNISQSIFNRWIIDYLISHGGGSSSITHGM